MENQKISNSEEKIRTALKSKWSKLSNPELQDVSHDHGKLADILKKHYALSKDDAKNQATSFFKPYEKKNVSGMRK